jgi:hypothetical protein
MKIWGQALVEEDPSFLRKEQMGNVHARIWTLLASWGQLSLKGTII